MKGSEKQIEWANTIKERIVQICDFALAQIEHESVSENQKTSVKTLWNKYKDLAINEESASFLIDTFKNITNNEYDDMQKRAQYFRSQIMVSTEAKKKGWK